MQPLSYFAFAFLCHLSFPSSVHSTECSNTQYAWKRGGQQLCCDMCQPGSHLVHRCGSSQTQCKTCMDMRYMQTYTVERTCNFCDNCNKSNMEYMSHCNATHNAVCRCKKGYECKVQPCKQCLPIPPTTRRSPTMVSAVPKSDTMETSRDVMWFLVISALLSIGIIACVVIKTNSVRWIISKYGLLCAKAHEPVWSEDEEVSKPVQEAGNVTNVKTDP